MADLRTAHTLFDFSGFQGRHLSCCCGHWSWKASHAADVAQGETAWAEHVELWRQAEDELDR